MTKEFNPILGYEEEKLELERICDIMNNSEKYRKLGVETPSGLMIKGNPGLGKTLMAECFIKASGREAFYCRKDKSDGDFVAKIVKAFDDAKNKAPSIVFLDDLDKFANEDDNHKNADEFITVQSCIDDCKGKEVFVLATANDVSCIPDSLLRAGRFDKVLLIQAPKYRDAIKIIEYYLGKKKYVSDDVDVEEITRIMEGKSCAELEVVINEAAIYAGFANKDKIEMEDIIKACLCMLFGAPENIQSDNEYLKEVAFHEAGHAVVYEVLEPGCLNLVSVFKNPNDIQGIISYSRNENYFRDKKYMDNMVKILLGGRAATELVFGRVDVGANSDLERAHSIVSRFIDSYCTYGFGMFRTLVSGDAQVDRCDIAASIEMERYYSETKQILAENRDFLDALAEKLMEKKTLLRKDVLKVRKEVERRKVWFEEKAQYNTISTVYADKSKRDSHNDYANEMVLGIPTAEFVEQNGDKTIAEVLGINPIWCTRYRISSLELNSRTYGQLLRYIDHPLCTPSGKHLTMDELLEVTVRQLWDHILPSFCCVEIIEKTNAWLNKMNFRLQ